MTSPTVVNTGYQFFYPETNSTLAVATTTANVNIGINGDVLMVQNDGTATAYVALGADTTVTVAAGGTVTAAATGGFPVLSGGLMQMRVLPTQSVAAGICDSGTTILRFTRGSGV